MYTNFGITEAIAAIPIFSIAYRHDESKTFYCYSNKAYPFAANKKLLNFNSIKNVFTHKIILKIPKYLNIVYG